MDKGSIPFKVTAQFQFNPKLHQTNGYKPKMELPYVRTVLSFLQLFKSQRA